MTQTKATKKIIDWLERDAIVIIVLLFAAFACLYTINSVLTYQDRINEHWMRQWQEAGCTARTLVIPVLANVSFRYWDDYNAT